MIQGYDISSFQGQIPEEVFQKWETDGWFVMIRANEGTPNNSTVLNIDSQFNYNLHYARLTKCLTGVYHFSYPTLNTAQSEADYFASIYTPEENEIIALDFETPIGGATPTQENVVWAKEWLDTVSSKLNGVKPLIYMNLNLANSLDWSVVSDAGYGIWLADWTGNPNQLGKANNWSFIAMSQFSDQALVPEINGRVDQDAFYGDAKQFQAYGYHAPVSVSTIVVDSGTGTVTTTPSSTSTNSSSPNQTSGSTSASDSSVVSTSTILINNLNAQIVVLKKELTSWMEENSKLQAEVKQLSTHTHTTVTGLVTTSSVWSNIIGFLSKIFTRNG
jgi:GH25 family lysozyme M1 (1,4-beta-N-acetylmuramidase)